MSEPRADRTWWGPRTIEMGQAGVFRIGPLEVGISHREYEWRVQSATVGDLLDSTVAIEVPGEPPAVLPSTRVDRFAASGPDGSLHLSPICADLPMVVRPGHSLSVLPKHAVTLYVSSPLWLRIEDGQSRAQLVELPLSHPSETWFGPSTTEGEICYATRVMGRLRADDFPYRPHRAITSIEIKNRTEDLMSVERVSLPVPNLSLYANEHGQLWTEAVSLERVPDQELARFETRPVPPRSAGTTQLVAGPRRAVKNPLVRAFSSIFRA